MRHRQRRRRPRVSGGPRQRPRAQRRAERGEAEADGVATRPSASGTRRSVTCWPPLRTRLRLCSQKPRRRDSPRCRPCRRSLVPAPRGPAIPDLRPAGLGRSEPARNRPERGDSVGVGTGSRRVRLDVLWRRGTALRGHCVFEGSPRAVHVVCERNIDLGSAMRRLPRGFRRCDGRRLAARSSIVRLWPANRQSTASPTARPTASAPTAGAGTLGSSARAPFSLSGGSMLPGGSLRPCPSGSSISLSSRVISAWSDPVAASDRSADVNDSCASRRQPPRGGTVAAYAHSAPGT